MKKILLISIFLIPVLLTAQRLTIEPPQEVRAGEPFQLRYFVDADADPSDFHLQLPSGLRLLNSARKSSFSSTTIVNGRRTDERGTNLTLVVQAQHAGTFRVPAATLRLDDGRTITSNSFSLVAVDDNKPSSTPSGEPQMQPIGSRITEADAFVMASADRTGVLEQQPVLISLRLYTRAGVAVDNPILAGSLPEVEGASIQNVSPGATQIDVVQNGGVTYKVRTIGRFMLIPSKAGTITLPPIAIRATALQRRQFANPIDEFFNNASTRIGIPIERSTKPLTIRVEALPEPRPADFSGGVGQMRLSASLLKPEVRANDVATLRLRLSGVGNMKHLSPPSVSFPSDFETYSPKTSDSTKLTRDGDVGVVNFDYTFVPRNAGHYEIPSLTFTYYDTAKRSYETLHTEAVAFDVLPDDRPAADVEAERELRQSDIAPLRRDDGSIFSEQNPSWWGTWSYWLTLLIILVTYFLMRPLVRRHLAHLADHEGMRRSRAGRVANKRLRTAQQLLAAPESQAQQFYDELAHALEGYLADKFSLPASERTRERIAEILASTNVPEDDAKMFTDALEQCDIARFAPAAAQDRRSLYDLAVRAIEGLETKSSKKMRNSQNPQNPQGPQMKNITLALIIIYIGLLLPASSYATRADSLKLVGDSLYDTQLYVEAAAAYEDALKDGRNAAVLQNLGNAYFRMNDFTKATVAYERALRIEPSNKQLRHNVALCATKIEDRFAQKQEMFFVTWTRALRDSISTDAWAVLGVFFFLLFICGLALYQLSERQRLRKLGFFGGGFMLLLFLATQMFAMSQRSELRNRQRAVVTASPAQLHESSAPQSRSERELHPGVGVTLTDSTREAYEVELPDGTRGWMLRGDVERI